MTADPARGSAGVDGCRAGWIAVIRVDGATPSVAVFSTFADLVSSLPCDTVIAVDMPIGLPDRVGHGGRGPEVLARRHLGARQSSVFSIPPRAAVACTDYREACRQSLALSDPPKKVSRQAFNLFPKIREIDTVLRDDPVLAGRVIESHPELAFWRLNGEQAMSLPKKIRSRVNPAGMEERRTLLARCGLARTFLDQVPPRGAGDDDFLDACAVSLIARRFIVGTAVPFPDPPPRDGYGLPVAIWA